MKVLDKYSYGYSYTVEVRGGPTGPFIGEFVRGQQIPVLASQEFWIHYKPSQPSYNILEINWSPLDIQDVISVDCTHTNWNVSVNITNLNFIYGGTSRSNIYLGMCNSPSTYTDGTLYLTPALTDCNTQKKTSQGVVSYENILAYRESSGIIFTNERWKVKVQCKLSSETSSHVDLKPPVDGHVTSTVQTIITGSGRPTTSIALFTDPYYYREPVTSGTTLNIGQTVYVKVRLSSSNPDDKMIVQDCYAKPTEDASKSQTYMLIDNGCVIDKNTHIDTTTDTETRFHFKMFAFTTERSHVHVYCDTSYCDKADPSIACQHGCVNAGKRSIRDVNRSDTVKLPGLTVI